MNKLRTKIFFSLTFLFLIIVALGYVGSSFISRLSADSGEIIKDNYATVEYTANMLMAINRLYSLHSERDLLRHDEHLNRLAEIKKLESEFEKNLAAEEANITEAGEAEMVNALKNDYTEFKNILQKLSTTHSRDIKLSGIQLQNKFENIENAVFNIYKINMAAILRKNNQAAQTAHKVSMYMLVLSTISSFVALIIILYLPKYIVRPIHELTGKIREISKGNYNQVLNIHSKDELGELSKAFNNMSSRLKEYESNNIHKLLIETRRLESVINSLGDAIIVLDENKTIISANKAAQQITGIKSDGLVGMYAPDIAANNDLMRELIKDLIFIKSDDINKNLSPIQIVMDNKESYFSKEIIEIKIQDGDSYKLIGYILLLKNITQFEERDSAKTNLIATVSHELKTPISSINLSLKLLENDKVGDMNKEQKHIIQTIRQQTVRLSKMVNDLLDFSQVESGNIRLKIEKVVASDIIDYAAVAMVMIIAEKKIQLDTNIADNLPCIQADVEKTVWVLVNLINNAVRYTPENGTIKISAQRLKKYVVISVEDQGPGIAPGDYTKVFNKFVQVGNNNPRGRGLGLAISKEFVITQGGDIWVESEIGVGSKFSFKLPIDEKS